MTTRREFLRHTALGAASLRFGAAPRAPELLIRGGTVVDGTGAPGRELDLVIEAGRVTMMAPRLRVRAAEVIDARGQIVAPGFIDIHSHADGSLTVDPRAESVIRQGITTIVVGADGSSPALGTPEASFVSWFDMIDHTTGGPNVAAMVGLGSVRRHVVGEVNRPPTAAELARMTTMVERALSEGACGVSSGLEYTPGAFATVDELIALCRPLAARRLPYATHLRNEDDRLVEAVDEAIAVARGAGCPLQISHLKTQGPRNWRRLDTVFQRIESARASGLDVAFDRYPYVAYSTGLTNLFPVWSRDGGTDAFFARLDDPAVSPRIRAETLDKVALIGGWGNVQISGVRAEADRAAEGARLDVHAQRLGMAPYETAVALLRRSGGAVGMLGFAMSEENLDRILAHPVSMVCTDGSGFAADGPARRGSPHPRGAGSFPRVLARYVRERKVLSLHEAVRRMTSAPAARLRLSDRGRLAIGLAADIVIFDPDAVRDTATFENPFQYPEGIRAVIVNGMVVLRDGVRASGSKGHSLRPRP